MDRYMIKYSGCGSDAYWFMLSKTVKMRKRDYRNK
jgi:hypothetical protein